MFIICQDYLQRTSLEQIKEHVFMLRKIRSKRYPLEIVTDTHFAADFAILANTPAQAESLLLSLEQAARGIGLYMNVDVPILADQQQSTYNSTV